MNRWSELRQWKSRVVMPRLMQPDAWLIIASAALVCLGLVMVFDVSYFRAKDLFGDPYLFFQKQLVAAVLGGIIFLVVSRIRPEVLDKCANTALCLTVVLLLLVLIPGIGVERGGARRWIHAGGFCFQPTELAKLTVVLYLARSIARRGDGMREFATGVARPLLVGAMCALLILMQRDFGGAVLLGLVLFSMLYIGGARVKHLGMLALGAAALLGIELFQAEYRIRRLLSFINPWEHSHDSGFQLVQSLIAFGSGGLSGVGLGQSRQKMFFLPEGHTDFIFALIGEELGLVGALLVLVLFGVVAARGFRIASRHPDRFSSLLAFGLTLVIVLGAVVNMGVVLGLLPTKGLVLPFMSYGGSALMMALFEVGILAALSRMTG